VPTDVEHDEEVDMLFYCDFTWFPGTRRDQVALRITAQHDAGATHPERITGWYNLAGGGAGFLLVDYDDIRELTAFLQPYMDLMSFDVRAVYQLDYEERLAELRTVAEASQARAGSAGQDATARHDFA
jgi:hypothetical protein